MANETLVPDAIFPVLGTWTGAVTDIDEGVGAATGSDYIFADYEASEIQISFPARSLAGPFLRVTAKIVARKSIGGGSLSVDVTPTIDSTPLSTQAIALTDDWQLFTLNWDGSWTASEIDSINTYFLIEQAIFGPRFELDAMDFVLYDAIPPDNIYQGGNLRVVAGNMCPRQGSYVWPVFPY